MRGGCLRGRARGRERERERKRERERENGISNPAVAAGGIATLLASEAGKTFRILRAVP